MVTDVLESFTPPSTYFRTITDDGQGYKLKGSAVDVLPSGAQPANRDFAFSPALSCPSSYATAFLTRIPAPQGGGSTETRVICCPVHDIPPLSGFSFIYNPDTSMWPWYSTLGCTLTANTIITLPYVTSDVSTTITAVVGMNAFSIQIAFQETDRIAAATTTTSQSSVTTSAGPQATLTATSSASGTSSPASQPQNPATTQIAVGVVVPVVIIAVLLAGFLIWRRRRSRSRPSTTFDGYTRPVELELASKRTFSKAVEMPAKGSRRELGGTPLAEMPT